MQFGTLREARLRRRYQRFLADVEFPDGEQVTVHCPNTGAMTGCAEPGSRVWLSSSDSRTRKYRYTWELVETPAGLACIHSARANKVVAQALAEQRIPGLEAYPDIQAEVKYGKGSRVDFLLEGDADRVFIEVKCVTLCRDGGVGLFPDAVSDRGRKHLRELEQMAQQENTRAVLFYCVFHQGIASVSAAADIDPRYRAALAEALASGVEVLAWSAQISLQGARLRQPLPFTLDPRAGS